MSKFIFMMIAFVLVGCGQTVSLERYQKLEADRDRQVQIQEGLVTLLEETHKLYQTLILTRELTFYVRQGGTGGRLYEFMPREDQELILKPLSTFGSATRGPVRGDMIVTVRTTEKVSEDPDSLPSCVFELKLWKIDGDEVLNVDHQQQEGALPPCNPEKQVERLDYSGTEFRVIISF